MKSALVAIVLIAGCNKGPKQEPPPQPAPKPAIAPTSTPSPAPAPAPAATPPAAPTTPGLTLDDGGKRGVVELIAIDDASDRTRGTFKVMRHCGAAAVAAVAKLGKQIAERTQAGTHDPPTCIATTDANLICTQGGNGEGDVGIDVIYRSDDAGVWRVVGVKTYAMGVTMDAQEAQFDKLVASSCP